MAKPPRKAPRTLSPDSSGTPIEHSGNPLGPTTGEITHPAPDAVNLPAAAGASSSALPAIAAPRTVTVHPLSPVTSPRPTITIHHYPEGSGQSRAAGWVSLHFRESRQAAVASTSTREQAQRSGFINAELASQLKLQPDTVEGFRYDKHNKAYVEMDDGMIMVGNTAHGWRQTHAGEATPTGKWVERIPGTKRWREIDEPRHRHQAATDPVSTETTDAIPGPSNRSQRAQEVDVASTTNVLVERLSAHQAAALDLSVAQWKNWGKATKPETSESIEIEGLHYPLVKQVLHADTELVYLQHPRFKPEGFNEFENMLRHESSLQPKWALKRNGQWRVLDNHAPFEMSPTQYVSTALRYLSEHSVNNLARAVFNRVSTPEGIDAAGLSAMTLTFRHWADGVNETMAQHSLSDPLMMLPRLPARHHDQYAGGLLTLPALTSNRLQRLDFDARQQDSMPSASSSRDFFERILGLSGYSINPNRHPHPSGEDVMIFHREGVAAIFVLRLTPVTQTPIPRYTVVGSELANPDFQSRLSQVERQALAEHLNHYEVVYLVGGKEQFSPDNSTLFIVREG
ncbi:hypothetical protein [Pseudomonas helmanticensis]|uniref:hypothetical protein n=1 Tax=Pseudomonas helmanticensis TaxID=1471381 RepID=UPI003806C4DA